MGLDSWSGRAAVVTGAGSGFGEAITRLLAKTGMRIVASDINLSAVEKLAESVRSEGVKGEVHPAQCDVAQESEVRDLYAKAKSLLGGVDVSVQCAGLSRPGGLLEGDPKEWRLMHEVNVYGTLYCCREAVSLMRSNGVDDGVLINLVSLAAHKWNPNTDMHFYGATKVMLLAMQEGIRQELRELNSNIRISGISPGQGNTRFYTSMYQDQDGVPLKMLDQQLEAEDIAGVVEYILGTPKHVQIHDVLIRPVTQP